VSCQKFAEIIAQLKKLKGKSAAEIEEALDTTKISEEKTLSDFLATGAESISTPIEYLALAQDIGEIPERVASVAIRKFPALGVARGIRVPKLITATRALSTIGTVLYFVDVAIHFAKVYEERKERWEAEGQITAFRQWARRLKSLTFQKESDFPTKIEIDLVEYAAELRRDYPSISYLQHPYYLALYYEEQYLTKGEFTSLSPLDMERMQQGFDEAVKLVEAEANEILSKADRIINDILRQGGLNNCKIDKLREAGIVDTNKARVLIMRDYAVMILDKTS
jgi:hypothetical protein